MTPPETPRLDMLWAEITSECQLACTHCYAGSGPGGGHGTMTIPDWEHVITQAAALRTRQITFIGGEPTLYPGLGSLVRLTVSLGMHAEIYTNLVHVTPALWDLFSLPDVSLATSWYTTDRTQHTAITGRDTWRQTRANITRATRTGITVRAGLIDGIVPRQRTADAERQLHQLGITDTGRDQVRQFGRGTLPDPAQACGNCGHRRAAVLPDGTVTPCPMTRWLAAGSVQDAQLSTIMESVTTAAATLPARGGRTCNPGDCHPDTYCAPLCTPSACKPNI